MLEGNVKQIKVGVIDTNMSEAYAVKHNICNIININKSFSSNATHADMVVDVICMSLTTFENNEEMQTAINTVQTHGIIVIAACLNYSLKTTYPAMYDNVVSVANCRNDKATICIVDKKIKDEFKNSKWGECSTSILTAYITGEISCQMSKSNFKLDNFIQKYNK